MGRKRKKRSKNKKAVEMGSKSLLSELNPGVKKTVLAIIFVVIALLFSLALFDAAGNVGELLNKGLALLVGMGRFFLPLFLFILAFMYFRRLPGKDYIFVWSGLLLASLGFLGLLHLFLSPKEMQEMAQAGKGGGYLGYGMAYLFVKLVDVYVAMVIFIAFLVIGVLVTFNSYFARLFDQEDKEEDEEDAAGGEKEALEGGAKVKNERLSVFSKIGEVLQAKPVEEEGEEIDLMRQDNFRLNKKADGKKKIGARLAQRFNGNSSWKLPPVSLLEKGSSKPSGGDVKQKSVIIQKTLANFGIAAEVVDTNVGPTVTQFAVKPADGTRLAKIVALQNDISMALAAYPIRIEAPIPGKSLVGIEIPNEKSALVRFRSLVENPDFFEGQGLNIVLGEDAAGNHFYADIGEMPHLLIAGATGAGKSIGVAGIIASLLYRFTPDELSLVLVDPKRVELSVYNGVPHLITPVIMEVDKVVNALKWVVAEMERRYQMLQEQGARDIVGYNAKIDALLNKESGQAEEEGATKIKVNGEDDSQMEQAMPVEEEDHVLKQVEKEPESTSEDGLEPERLPYLVVVIDELADIMVASGKEVETLIVRVAQKARAVGIHLVLSTQRPSVEIITGLIKANIPTRIAYQVASQIDSRTILDMAGAEKLLGKGDMLFLARDGGQPKRIQGSYIQEEEVAKVVDFWKKQGEASYDEDVVAAKGPANGGGAGIFDNFSGEGGGGHDDELFEPAKQVVIEHQKASATLLQRKLKVGYARAARLIEMLEEEGIIGPANGAKPRDILIGRSGEVDYEDDGTDQSRRDNWQM